jgi:DNA-damage-inducible protein D
MSTIERRMVMNEIKEYTEKLFEDIKHIDENNNEYWLARELQQVLEYREWRKFNNVINKAIIACKNSKVMKEEHFVQVDKTIKMPRNASKIINDYKLSRYACYLIVQNADSKKEVIALGQTYFAIQTRKQELSEKEYNELSEDEKRLYRRNQARKGNYNLNQTAVKSGVKDLARFHNAGYKGLYNGETADDIFKRKKLRYREDILDNMCSEELANNIFRIAQTDAKLKRDNVDNEYTANSVHYEVGKEVRNSIKRLGGTMPEDLPTPDKSLKELEKENKSQLIDKKI